MKDITAEYQFGYSEKVEFDANAIAEKIIESCVHSIDTLHCGGILENCGKSSVAFYERDINGVKCFVSRIHGTAAQIKAIYERIDNRVLSLNRIRKALS